ncbi:SSI family serine proteinase inhibitor [Aeromicrobium sp. A1-2]|uniref:SSI family serine proteinase inhibitor n=1 Tax=Aeromicrobium sp. A1-2 TaxID=2107713 RepID=UPI001C1F5A4A|nr:SSI family serine proteinase inhibitor [Aeromicrobium sp. A1-2]
MRSLLVTLVAAGLLSACGAGSSNDSAGSEPAGAGDAGTDATTSLAIVVTPDEGVTPKAYTLTCDPDGGDHPQAEQACAALDAAGVEVLSPVPADQTCTEVYGGPQVATVRGTYDGVPIDATFNRTNGCEIDRWEQLGTTFFDVPML